MMSDSESGAYSEYSAASARTSDDDAAGGSSDESGAYSDAEESGVYSDESGVYSDDDDDDDDLPPLAKKPPPAAAVAGKKDAMKRCVYRAAWSTCPLPPRGGPRSAPPATPIAAGTDPPPGCLLRQLKTIDMFRTPLYHQQASLPHWLRGRTDPIHTCGAPLRQDYSFSRTAPLR